MSSASEADARPSFEALYRTHVRDVWRWVARLGRPHVEVEDAVQEVFSIASRRLPDFRGDAPIGAWLFRITQKVVANHRRKQRLRRWLGLTAPLERTTAAAGPSPEESTALLQTAARFDAIMERLAPRHREILLLFEVEELSTQEVAALYGIEVSTARVWLHRARNALIEENEKWEGKKRTR